MSGRHEAMPDGELFFVADRMLKARSVETVAATVFALGSTGRRDVVMVTVRGEINNSGGEADDVTVAFDAVDVPGLLRSLLHSYKTIQEKP